MTASLNDIMSGRVEPVSDDTATAPVEPTADKAQADTGASRDDKGRFAPKQPEAAVEPPQAEPQPQTQGGTIPIQAFDAERKKRKDLEDRLERETRELREQLARLSQPQTPAEPPKPPPSIWDSPEEFLQSQLSPVEQRIRDMNERYSERLATREHGADVVSAAKEWITEHVRTPQGMRLVQELAQSDDPFEDLVQHYKKQSVLTEIGDPAAYKEKLRAELLAELQQQQQSQPAPSPAAGPLPTAFAKGPSPGPRGGPEYGGPRPLTDIMKR